MDLDWHLLWLLLLVLFLNQCAASRVNFQAIEQPNVPAEEIAALFDLYNGTGGTNWEWNSYLGGMEWNFTDPNPCADMWMGITCSETPTIENILNVEAVNLALFGMRGTLPASLCNLTQLTVLNVADNFLSGSIPAILGQCVYLEEMYLHSNSFVGTIPSALGNISSLTYLELYGNNLTGSIPDTIGHCTQLQELDLHANLLTGAIPHTLCQCSQLSWLSLYQNRLNGSIPVCMQNCTQLDTINLYDNQLTGIIPPLLLSLENLLTFALFNNQLTGIIPEVIGPCTYLDNINLSGNLLGGSIPASIGQCTGLEVMDFHNNRLTGNIPDFFGRFDRIQRINLGQNRLTGHFSYTLGESCFDLTSLILNDNSLSGTVPVSLERCEDFLLLDISHNQFIGTLPGGFLMPSGSLRLIQCSHNLLTGQLPNTTTGESNNILILDLSYNRFSGSIPSSFIQSLFGVYRLFLGYNQFTGCLPDDWTSLAPTLSILSLQENRFSGTIPDSLGELTLLQSLNLTSNRLSGTIPTSFQRLFILQALLLKDNQLRGNISRVFSRQQKNLTIVQLSGNQLTGTLPLEVFLLPNLQSFAAVSNCFEGPLPVETICPSTSLVALVLDGFHSASTCRHRVSLSNQLFQLGTLPPCLLSMEKLSTLHLSGSGLTGTLPTSASISSVLTDLSLSHNLLTGDIAGNILARDWVNLDLSYNRLTGTLYDSRNVPFGNHTALYLDHNRLSGVIPRSIADAGSVSILESNIFSCRIDRTDVPVQDPVSSKYTCGSDAVNNPFYAWLGCVVATALIAWFVHRKQFLVMLRNWLLESDGVNLVGFQHVMRASKALLILGTASTAYCLVVLLPVYGLFVTYDPTFTYQYAWTVSGAYFTGSTAFVVEAVLLLLQLPLCAWLAHSLGLVRLSVFAKSDSIVAGRNVDATEMKRGLLNGIILFSSVTVVAGANVAFVIATLNLNGRALTIIQILLALFKLSFNNYAMPAMQQLVHKYFSVVMRGEDLHRVVVSKVVLALINVLVIPCIVVMFISPDCFYDALIGAKEVNSMFEYLGLCETLLITTTDGALNPVSCVTGSLLQDQTSYTPPFSYSYQCSSSFVTFYAPTFVIMCIISAFFIPLQRMLLLWLRFKIAVTSPLFARLYACTPRLLRELPSVEEVAMCRNNPYSRPLFAANHLLTSLLVYVALLLTFGALFPPLAVCCVVAMASMVLTARLEVGQFLLAARLRGRLDCVDEIERSCTETAPVEVIQASLFLVLSWSCMFYTLFLFDTLGNEVGLIGAFWVLIVVPVLPLGVYSVFLCAREFFGVKVVEVSEVGVELTDVSVKPVNDRCDINEYGNEKGIKSSINPLHSV